MHVATPASAHGALEASICVTKLAVTRRSPSASAATRPCSDKWWGAHSPPDQLLWNSLPGTASYRTTSGKSVLTSLALTILHRREPLPQSPSWMEILLQILDQVKPTYLHLGLPCGTCSRARRPIAKHLVAQGAPQPQPLRSAEHPLGLPSLKPTSISGQRAQSANKLYRFAIQVPRWAFNHEAIVSIENPHRSWLWTVLLHLVRETADDNLWRHFAALHDIEFANCMHGGTRLKITRWRSTASVFASLQLACDGGHDHASYQLESHAAGWQFDTAAEAS